MSGGEAMSRICWWLVDVVSRALTADERDVVLGDFAESGETGRESAMEDWWALTDECWDLLGLIKSPRYR